MVMAHWCPDCEATQALVNALPRLLVALEVFDAHPMATAAQRRLLGQQLPERGVYAFYDEDGAAYVGRSDRLCQRVLEHGRPAAGVNRAPVARQIEANEIPEGVENRMAAAAEVVRQMNVRAVAIDCPNVQAAFEVYAFIALGHPRYNDFAVH